jgi:ribosomal protein S20
MISQGISIQSFSLSYTQSSTDQQDFRTNIKSLVDAIKNGNLQDAQAAYGKITDALNSSSQSGGADSDGDSDNSSASDSPFKAFLDAIGKSLSSNDIGGAQKALSDFEANRPKGPPPGGHAGVDQLSADAKNAFIDLIKSIRSGDLSGAKTSLATLLDQQTQNAAQSQSPLDTFLSQVGSALDNGDLDAAQKALQSLAQQKPQGAAVDFSA